MRLQLFAFGSFWCACAQLCACGQPPAAAAPPALPSVVEVAAHPPPAAGDVARTDTFGALLQRLVERGDEASGSAECLFRESAGNLGFSGRFAPAVQPLPLHTTALATLLREGGAVDVLTRYGRYGKRLALPLFAAITDGTPRAQAALVAQTAHGVLLRAVGEGALVAAEAHTPDAVVSALVAAHVDSAFVTADTDVALAALAPLLSTLARARVATTLVAALPPSAALRTEAARDVAFEGSCPNGLPEERGELGELSVAALRAGIAPLTSDLLACLSTGEIGALHGGRVRLALRIDARGQVSQSCIVASDLHDSAVLGCVIKRASGLRFAAPSPVGSVDAELPLVMQPEFTNTPRALCSERAD